MVVDITYLVNFLCKGVKMRKDLKEKLEKIEELEKALNTVKNELEFHYSKLILELEKSNQTKFSHIEQRVDFLLSNNPCSKELEYLKELVLTNLKEYSNIILQLREQMIKQNSIINLAAKNAVDSALQGEIRALVVSEIKTMVSDTGKTMLYDESKNSILGVSKDVTEDVISVLQDKISSLIVEDHENLTPEETSLMEQEKRKATVLALERHQSFQKLYSILQSGLMPMLVGPAGTGKSTAIEQAAFELGLDFYTSNRVQMAYELTGYKDATGKYQPTQFYQAYKNGGVFFLDEIDGSSPEALVTINTAMAQGYMSFPDGKVYMHENFKFVAAGNTYGTGYNTQYVGRNELDAATLDRFVVIKWDYDKNLERKLINDQDLLDFVWEIRRVVSKLKLPIIISTRGLINLNKLAKIKDYSLTEALENVLFEGIDPQNIYTILREVKINNKYTIALRSLADNLHAEEKN